MEPNPTIGRAELDILRYITSNPSVTVREVADHFGKTKGHVRTTILNVMERLREKGFLKRKKIGGMYRYFPRVQEERLLQTLVSDFVQKTLRGSIAPFVAYLSEEGNLTGAELQELRQVVRDLKSERKEDSDAHQ
jgi:predicted transcriptional regulator